MIGRRLLTIGVEEEFFIVDPATRGLSALGLPLFDRLKRRAPSFDGVSYGFDNEYQLSIVESRTRICEYLSEAREEILGLRRALIQTATHSDLSIVSSGTLPLANWRTARATKKPRYQQIGEHYRDVVERRATCGFHVHIGIPDQDLAVQVLNRIRPWLPILLALSVSSPFYDGADTGYESSRYLLWGGFPVAGLPDRHDSHNNYSRRIEQLIATGSIMDRGQVYWDARLGTRYPTLEFRIADGCPRVDTAVLQAGLARALVLASMQEIERGQLEPAVIPDVYRAAAWRAARSGLQGDLIDVLAVERVPAPQMVDRFLDHLRPALEELGDWDEILELVESNRRLGTSAYRQRTVFQCTKRLEEVVDALVIETAS